MEDRYKTGRKGREQIKCKSGGELSKLVCYCCALHLEALFIRVKVYWLQLLLARCPGHGIQRRNGIHSSLRKL